MMNIIVRLSSVINFYGSPARISSLQVFYDELNDFDVAVTKANILFDFASPSKITLDLGDWDNRQLVEDALRDRGYLGKIAFMEAVHG